VQTLQAIVEHARKEGRFPKAADNPFSDQRREFKRVGRDTFTDEEALKLFDAFGPREIAPAQHTPQTALPWIVLIAAHSGACLEEVCQLTVGDVKTQGTNGGSIIYLDIHNGDPEHQLKNDDTRPRKIPLHPVLEQAGLLKYKESLPSDGRLFPGLVRRSSRDNKLGTWVGRLFNKKREALGIDRADALLDFHSWRTTAATKMRQAGVPEPDLNDVLGHAHATESTRSYAKEPDLDALRSAIKKINYKGFDPEASQQRQQEQQG
jgi:integrase